MLFTNIQLDDFLPTLSRFMERLHLEGAEEREWIMMAIINISALLEYGKPTGVLRSTGDIGVGISKDSSLAAQAAAASAKVNLLMKKVDEMEVDDTESSTATQMTDINAKANGVLTLSPSITNAHISAMDRPEPPLAFKYALQLTFEMLAYTLKNPLRKANPFARPSLNPYNTVLLTFLATVLKHSSVLSILERAVPWDALAEFFNTMPRNVLSQAENGVRLTSGTLPLPEDWCIRGMEWGGRRVFERGFWKSGEDRHAEMEVLDAEEAMDSLTDGIIEDEDDESDGRFDASDTVKRWVRIARTAGILTKAVPGLSWVGGSRSFSVTGQLEEKLMRWKEEDRVQREEEECRRSRRPWSRDEMDIDAEDSFEDVSEEDDSDSSDGDTEEVKALKAKRRQLLQMLHASSGPVRSRPKRDRTAAAVRQARSLRLVPGFTVLVIDTNILLSSLSMFSSLVESMQWTVLVPLAVITELDGIAKNASELGNAATAAIDYISSHIRTHSLSLKVQTSRGNYLHNLNVRGEEVEFSADSWERNMDDLILRAAVWQDDHWVDRSSILNAGERDTKGAAKVVLMSFDRNCEYYHQALLQMVTNLILSSTSQGSC